jgi:hypothetical protein
MPTKVWFRRKFTTAIARLLVSRTLRQAKPVILTQAPPTNFLANTVSKCFAPELKELSVEPLPRVNTAIGTGSTSRRTSLAGITQRELTAIERELNERPRKTDL